MDTIRLTKQALQFNQKWLEHVQRMETNRLPNRALQYKPKVAITRTENGHKQTTKPSTII